MLKVIIPTFSHHANSLTRKAKYGHTAFPMSTDYITFFKQATGYSQDGGSNVMKKRSNRHMGYA